MKKKQPTNAIDLMSPREISSTSSISEIDQDLPEKYDRDQPDFAEETEGKDRKERRKSQAERHGHEAHGVGPDDVPLEDDSHMPAMTVRAIISGILVSCTAAVIQQFFLFKPSRSTVQPLFLQLTCLLVGRCLQNIPGPTWWNPGPYSIKENSLSSIMATAAAVGTLAVEMIATQELYDEKPFHYATAMAIMLSSQLIGYGFAGLLRVPFVYSKQAVFPAVLPSVALFHSFHDQSQRTKKQMRLFKRAFVSIGIYEIFPQYIAPTLQAVSVFCLAWQDSALVTRLFGGALVREGLGILSLSFDWNVISSLGPLYTPFGAQVNEWAGVLLGYIFYTIGWEESWFAGGKSDGFSFLSSQLYYSNGTLYDRASAIKSDGTADWEVIERIGAPYLSTSFILSNIATNLAVGAAFTHCVLWGWDSIATMLFFKGKLRDKDRDMHQVVCQKYPEVPLWVYLCILFFAVSVAFLAASLTDSGLSALALTMALLLAAILVIASAYLKATTGAALEVQPVIQMLGGIAFPGDAFGNMWFTTYGSATVSQSISMLQDLKLGQYMHLAPMSVFICQIIGTVCGVVFNYMVMSLIVSHNRDLLLSEYGNHVFTGIVLEDFWHQAISWGIFAHELFRAGARYFAVPLSLPIGLLLPIPFYVLHRFFPRLQLHLVNTPLIWGAFALVLNRVNAGFFLSVVAGFLSQFYARRYQPKWFYRSNYVLSAALDGGAQVTAVLLGFIVEGGAGWDRVIFPHYFLNPRAYPEVNRGPDYCSVK